MTIVMIPETLLTKFPNKSNQTHLYFVTESTEVFIAYQRKYIRFKMINDSNRLRILIEQWFNVVFAKSKKQFTILS